MANVNLGKKNNFENGTFMAYACSCTCYCYCGTCKNCNSRTLNSTGTAILNSVNISTGSSKALSTLILFG